MDIYKDTKNMRLVIQVKVEGRKWPGSRRTFWLMNLKQWSGKRAIQLFRTAVDRVKWAMIIANVLKGWARLRRRRRYLFGKFCSHTMKPRQGLIPLKKRIWCYLKRNFCGISVTFWRERMLTRTVKITKAMF